MCVFFCMETPLRGRSGGHTGTAPTVSFGDCAQTVGFVWVIARRQLVSFGWITCGRLMPLGGLRVDG